MRPCFSLQRQLWLHLYIWGSCRGTKTIVHQSAVATEGAMRAASPEIQEPGESSGAALLRDVRGSDARVLKLASVP
jgi:hypothetical protein